MHGFFGTHIQTHTYTTMKHVLFLPLLAVALSLSIATRAQDFNTGSGFMNSGSAYSSTVTAVGSTGIDYSTDQGVANRGRGSVETPGSGTEHEGNQDGGYQDEKNFPIGSSAILFAFAAMAAGVVAVRRRRLV